MPRPWKKLYAKSLNGGNELAATTLTQPTKKQQAKDWATARLSDPNTLILDIESTGILSKDPDTEIVQLCIINTAGRPVLTMMLKPDRPMSAEVQAVHGITNDMVQDKPFFIQVAKIISKYLEGKHVVSYNADFDISLLMHMFDKYKEPRPKMASASCCMDQYSAWVGEVSKKNPGEFKWQKLPNLSGMLSHDALTDCISTLKVMQKMAGLFDEATQDADLIELDF
jgi:DNA polymerase III epsilon subunit-like protein